MSAVLCLPACLCVSAAASRGQAPHGNASVPLCDLDQVLLKEVMAENRGLTLSDLKSRSP